MRKTGILIGLLLAFPLNIFAAIRYVNVNNAAPAPPYLEWSTAAVTIQDAVDAATNGDTILVTNGVYATGGVSMDGGILTNRVSINKVLTVQSVNGPDKTIIQGAFDPILTNGPGAVRCVWMTNNAVLSGFTLRGGATRAVKPSPAHWMRGGGVWGSSTSAVVINCIIIGNAASHQGGGAYRVTLEDCTLFRNYASGSGFPGSGTGGSAGGAAWSVLRRCTIAENVAHQSSGGGTIQSYLENCAVIGNSSYFAGAADSGTLVNCTVVSNVSGGYGSGGAAIANANLTNCIVVNNPLRTVNTNRNYMFSTFTHCNTSPLPPGAGNIDTDPQLVGFHISMSSPCIAAGTNVSITTDIDGQPRKNAPSMGCDEFYPEVVLNGLPGLKVESSSRSLLLNASVAGQPPFSFWWVKDGTILTNDGSIQFSDTENLVIQNLEPGHGGAYQFVATNSSGAVTSATVRVMIRAVNPTGLNPTPPYSSWPTAATNIHDAIEASSIGDIVLVTNGIYASGGKMISGVFTRLAVEKPVVVMSVNGYLHTIIEGAWDPVSTNGALAVRGVWLADGAVLRGFTVRNGATTSQDSFPAGYGGGIYCVSSNSMVFNCVLTNNSAVHGGGIYGGTIHNSLLTKNWCGSHGAGAYSSILHNCTVRLNSSLAGGSFSGIGIYDGVARNSIIQDNYASARRVVIQANYFGSNPSLPFMTYSSTYPLKSGTGNISDWARCIDAFHISATSPCRGAGHIDLSTGVDLDGEPWLNPPSMGCDEVVPENLVGPISVFLSTQRTNFLVMQQQIFDGTFEGRVSHLEWSFGDGLVITNAGSPSIHQWTEPGDYLVSLTAYNLDHPGGVTASVPVFVAPMIPPDIRMDWLEQNHFAFEFDAQANGFYTVYYATNLQPPVSWKYLTNFHSITNRVDRVTDTNIDGMRFYRIQLR